LSEYGISPPVKDGRGIPLAIDATDDPYFGRSIRLTIGRRRSTVPCPLNEFEAQRLVDEFRLAHLLPDVFHEDMTLVHLLLKCSRLYVERNLVALHLDCHLSTRGYRVNEARMATDRALHVPSRLEPHARPQSGFSMAPDCPCATPQLRKHYVDAR
jgi:hypothetical protein